MLNKEQKIKFVEEGRKELKKYSLVGIIPLNSIPDRLVQSSRNRMRAQVRFLIAKKSLLSRILEGDARTKPLVKELTGTSVIILSNEDPFQVYKGFKSGQIKLAAKPNQISPEDIEVKAGETSVQPGQAVTELKQAGIDVQIQKGKVVIAKDKVIVKKGGVISNAVAKALKTLDIIPFSASITPSVLFSGNLMFTRDILNIDAQQVRGEVHVGFSSALAISLKAKIVNAYTIKTFLAQAYREAIAVGMEGHTPEPGILDKLVAQAAMQASALNSMVKEPPKEAAPAPQS